LPTGTVRANGGRAPSPDLGDASCSRALCTTATSTASPRLDAFDHDEGNDMSYVDTEMQQPPVKKQRHIFRWVFLAIQVLFLIWIISGVNSASDNCDGEVGTALDACQAGTAVGAGIGVGIVIFLWVAVDIILGITYLIFRKKR
jgi:hypothetical protein